MRRELATELVVGQPVAAGLGLLDQDVLLHERESGLDRRDRWPAPDRDASSRRGAAGAGRCMRSSTRRRKRRPPSRMTGSSTARTRNAAIMWPALARDRHELGDRRLDDRRVVGAFCPAASRPPALRRRCEQLDEVALLERPQELVLVAEAGVEAAHRRPGAARDLRDRHRGVALLLDQRLGRVEQPLQRALAARLLGPADALEWQGEDPAISEPESDSVSYLGSPNLSSPWAGPS